MTNDDILRTAAALLCKNEKPDPNGCVMHFDTAISKICRMAGVAHARAATLNKTLLERIAPHSTMAAWMAAKRPNQRPPTPEEATRHAANWLLHIAGPGPKPTLQDYKPRRRR